ncbi:MAG: M48 family metallopeptidase [Holosporales bacterium]
MTHAIPYGSAHLIFSLERRTRKTLAIHVYPSGAVSVIAPFDAPLEKIHEKVKKRAAWITRQKLFFQQFQPGRTPQLYESGAACRYLGRQYRLKVQMSIRERVAMSGGTIVVYTHTPKRSERVQRLLEDWQRQKAKERLHERVKAVLERFPDPDAVTPTGIIIRSLDARWGSMTPAGNLVLNPRLIGASVPCIDAIITHELCHRVHPNHSPAFWRFLNQVYPEWQKYKTKLERDLC